MILTIIIILMFGFLIISSIIDNRKLNYLAKRLDRIESQNKWLNNITSMSKWHVHKFTPPVELSANENYWLSEIGIWKGEDQNNLELLRHF